MRYEESARIAREALNCGELDSAALELKPDWSHGFVNARSCVGYTCPILDSNAPPIRRLFKVEMGLIPMSFRLLIAVGGCRAVQGYHPHGYGRSAS
jgi:hypothetical protein